MKGGGTVKILKSGVQGALCVAAVLFLAGFLMDGFNGAEATLRGFGPLMIPMGFFVGAAIAFLALKLSERFTANSAPRSDRWDEDD